MVYCTVIQRAKIIQKGETQSVICSVLPIREDIAYKLCFTGAETEIHKIKDDINIRS